MSDAYTEALNHPSGQLAEVLISRVQVEVGKGGELSRDLRARLDRLIDAPGRPGLLARVRLAADVALLFNRAPTWTTERIVPQFSWSSSNAADIWSARRYSSFIGSPTLFGLTKQPFLEMFGRDDISADDLETFAAWLTAILIANQADHAGYPLCATEARAALRRAGARVLPSVGYRLAVEMERATDEQKPAHWKAVVRPVFEAAWPLDVELQTPAATFRLVQIILATGKAFAEACSIIIPFIRPEDTTKQTTVFSISKAPDELYNLAPAKMLDLTAAVTGEAPPKSIYVLGKALTRLRMIDPKLADTRKFQRLLTYSSQQE